MNDAIRFWDRRATGYDGNLPPRGLNYAARLDRALKVAPPGARLLDVGCATGQITLDLADRLAREGGSVLGIDAAPRMIEIAEAKRRELGRDNATFASFGPEDPSLRPSGFDVVTCYSVFHLVPDWRAMVQRFAELLSTGGWVLSETPCLGDWGPWWRPALWAARRCGAAPPVGLIRVAELEDAFATAGLDVVESAIHNPKSGMHCVTARKA